MKTIKKLLNKILNKNVRLKSFILIGYKKYRYDKSILKLISYFIKGIFNFYHPSLKITKGHQIKNILSKTNIIIDDNRYFLFSIDYYRILIHKNNIIENTTIDYDIILENSIDDFYKKVNKLNDTELKDNLLSTLDGISYNIDNTIKKLKKSNKNNKDNLIRYFERMKTDKAEHFEEALQRILYFNQLLWQTGHGLNGFGKLDNILYKYYQNDYNNNIISNNNSKILLKEFIQSIHGYYWFKSSVLLGDTGQIIVLGGNSSKNNYFCNELTYQFIDVIKELQLPDPKILLRVANNIPDDLLNKSLKCIATGIGCPLFANDEIIINKLIEFGYSSVDAYNYITSACWEPLIPGKSVEQNNVLSYVFMKPFLKMLDDIKFINAKSLNELLKLYSVYLNEYTIEIIDKVKNMVYEKDPLISLFIPNCLNTNKDISDGGAVYNNYGVTSVSLGNVVNSFLNIDYFVFKHSKYSLNELNEYRKNNFIDSDHVLKNLKNQSVRYGMQEKKVIELSNKIISMVNKTIKENPIKENSYLKFGLSSPSYIMEANNTAASFDGRKNNDPFMVHISSDAPMMPYTELINFASSLNYGKYGFNGNVVDFMVTPTFINSNFNKFKDFIALSIDIGFFEMQMNVISSEILIKAKDNPNLYKNLIVRVWGFSAYFNDLPEEYKNILIERALKNEGQNY